MERWTKEPCLSCEVARRQITDVAGLHQALLKCKYCEKKCTEEKTDTEAKDADCKM